MNHRARLIIISLVVFAWSGIIMSRLVNIQFQRSDELKQRAERQYRHRIILNPKRGTISDRRGRTLAINVDAPSAYAVPTEISDPEGTAEALTGHLERPAHELVKLLTSPRNFVWLRRKITPELKREIGTLNLEGIHFVTESKRIYPAGRLACHVIGFAGMDNDGLGGVEYHYDRYLKGREGLMIGIRGAKRGYFLDAGKIVKEPTGGYDLKLTLDSVVQFIVEEELRAAVATTGSESGTVVVMDHESGAILAMANFPDYDPNRFSTAPAESLKNRAVVDAYEPGSTFKLITAAAALKDDLVDLNEIFDCGNGSIQLGRRTIRDHTSFSELTFRAVFEKSSNVGVIRVGMRIGEERLRRMAAEFGFGAPSGIDLPAENPGLLRPVKRWSRNSIGSVSIGQEVSGNPVHILLMAAVVANGGYWVRPHVVASVSDANGKVVYSAEVERRRVITERTAETLRELSRGVVLRGTGTEAEIAGVPVAGKTGTAEVAEPGDGYIPEAYVASFVGFLPAHSPRVTMLCLLNRPRGKYYGGDVAAPLFRAIGTRISKELEIPGDDQDSIRRRVLAQAGEAEIREAAPPIRPVKRIMSQPATALAMPDLRGLSLREALAHLLELGVVPEVEGSGRVVRHTPSAGEPIGGGTVLYCGTGLAQESGR